MKRGGIPAFWRRLRLGTGIGAALCCCLLFGGCSGQAAQENRTLTLYLRPYGYLSPDAQPLTGLLAAFRESHPDVELVLDDHSRDDDIDGSRAAVEAALMSGKGPDVILEPDFLFADVEKTMRSGVLADLGPFLEADPDYRPEEYNQRVLAAGACQGKQLLFPMTYSINYLLTTKSILDKAGMMAENCGTWLSAAREIERYKTGGGTVKTFDQSGFGGDFAQYLGLSLLDYDKKTADFSAPELEEAATLYKTIYEEEQKQLDSYDTMAGYQRLSQGKCLFAAYSFASLRYLFLNAGAAAAAGEEPLMLPVLGVDGKSSGTVSFSAGINANSQNQQNAYAFIKLLRSEECLQSESFDNELPIRSSTLESSMKEVRKELDAGICEEVLVAALPERYYQEYQAVLDNLGQIKTSYALEIKMGEYLKPFYLGEASYESCKRALEESMEIYLSE